MEMLQAVRVLVVAMIAFLAALCLTPLVVRVLAKYQFGKHIRVSEATPVYTQLHKNKEGTPTAGGVIIWLSVLGLAFLFRPIEAVAI